MDVPAGMMKVRVDGEIKLRRVQYIKRTYDYSVGYEDHHLAMQQQTPELADNESCHWAIGDDIPFIYRTS